MTYRIEFTTAAAREIHKLPRRVRDGLLDAIEDLGDDPRPHGAKKLVEGKAGWRIRVDDFRVIYDVSEDALTVTIVRAAHRREAHSR